MFARAVVILVLALGATAGARGFEVHAAVAVDPDPKGPLARAPARDGGVNAVSVLGNSLWAVPLSRLSATRDRPLFSASRRPPAPAAVAAAPSPPQPVAAPPPTASRPSLLLIGTLVGESLRIGIFHDEATTKTLRLAVGENHDGWNLRALGTAEARFENGERAATLELRRASQLAMQGSRASSDPDPPMPPARHRKR
jgi:hypothetical protein